MARSRLIPRPIPGFMDAMTMPYKVKDANVLQDLHPGDHMTGVLLVGGTTRCSIRS